MALKDLLIRGPGSGLLFGYKPIPGPMMSRYYINHRASKHWGLDRMAANFRIYQNAFSGIKIYKLRLRFHLNLFQRIQLHNIPALVRWLLYADQTPSNYLNQWWLSLFTHICVTRPQWVKGYISIAPMDIYHDVYDKRVDNMSSFCPTSNWVKIHSFYFGFSFSSSVDNQYWGPLGLLNRRREVISPSIIDWKWDSLWMSGNDFFLQN